MGSNIQTQPMKTGAPPDHIVVVMEENHGYSQIIGNSDAPYINSLAAAGTLFTNYRGVGHPSAPNYLALFSGSTQGITEDGTYFFPSTPTLASELQRAGYSFVGYAEPPIDRDHNPWLSFGDSRGRASGFQRVSDRLWQVADRILRYSQPADTTCTMAALLRAIGG